MARHVDMDFVAEVVNFFNVNRSTVRKTAKYFCISKQKGT